MALLKLGQLLLKLLVADEDFQKVNAIAGCRSCRRSCGALDRRMIFGSAPKGSKPVVVHRDYQPHDQAVQKALELAPELQNLMESIGVEVGVGVPIMKDDHELLRVVYRFDSMVHWGQSVDKMVTDERFLGLINAAHEAATLKSSRMLVKVT